MLKLFLLHYCKERLTQFCTKKPKKNHILVVIIILLYIEREIKEC